MDLNLCCYQIRRIHVRSYRILKADWEIKLSQSIDVVSIFMQSSCEMPSTDFKIDQDHIKDCSMKAIIKKVMLNSIGYLNAG